MLLEFLGLKTSSARTHRKKYPHDIYGHTPSSEDGHSSPFSEELFTQLLCLERKRAERSRKPFAVLLIDASKLIGIERRNIVVERLAVTLSLSIRETDVCGWYKDGCVIGIILNEIGSTDVNALRSTMLSKVHSILQISLAANQIDDIRISFHIFPEGTDSQNGGPGDPSLCLYPDLHPENDRKRAARVIKRVIDIIGSLTALIVLSPIFLAIAIGIKLSSKGPVLFKQKRIGEYGVWFTFLKFRSMYVTSDARIHQEYVRQFISGKVDCKHADNNGGAFKLQGDSRITPFGRFLRKTSLDELPQFYNVLRGDMSLVGPRPPIPYEIDAYDIWHRRRYLEVKPGITGLWQIKGRSKVTFDEMVRLDLRYAKDWSLRLDLKILAQTPRVVLFGKGAY